MSSDTTVEEHIKIEGTRRGDCKVAPSQSGDEEMATQDRGDTRWERIDGLRIHKWALGIGYLLAVSVCGAVFTAQGFTLYEVAINCGSTATKVGSVFIIRGVGSVVGSAMCPKLYSLAGKNTVLFWALLTLGGVLLYTPFISSVAVLHLSFFLLGVMLSIVDTGSCMAIAYVFKARSGPWLSGVSIAFAMSGLLAPVVKCFTRSLLGVYAILAAISVVASIYIAIPQAPETVLELAEEVPSVPEFTSESVTKQETKWWNRLTSLLGTRQIEMHVAGMVLFAEGSQVVATSYLNTYVEFSGVVAQLRSGLLVVDLWVGLVLGRILGFVDQQFLTLPRLYRHLTLLYFGGTIVTAAIVLFKSSVLLLWVGLFASGLFQGPLFGFAGEMCTRITPLSDVGVSIVMAGANVGASVMPWFVALLLETTRWPQILFVAISISQLAQFPLMLSAKRLAEATEARNSEALLSSNANGGASASEGSPLLSHKRKGTGERSSDASDKTNSA